MCGLKRARQREREEKDARVFIFWDTSINRRATTDGDTIDIFFRFTTHSSDCLFTSWYVRCVCLCDIFISVCPCLYINLHILYVLLLYDCA